MEGWIKLNSDGSVANDRRASCEGLLHGTQGEFLGGFAANLGVCLISVAEIWDAYYGLLLAWNKGFCKVLLEMESTSAISLMRTDFNSRHPYASMIHHVKRAIASKRLGC